MSIRALIVDDHPIIRDAIVASLLAMGLFDESQTASSLEGLEKALQSDSSFDVIILDLSLTDSQGSRSIEFIREHYPKIPILVFSAYDSLDVITQCFEYGVHGFVSKNASIQSLASAVRLVLAGGMYIPPDAAHAMGFVPSGATERELEWENTALRFTPKQQQVFDLLLLGLPNKLIARRLDLAEGTVKTHLHGIYQILRVNSRAQAILKARQLGRIQ
jgi:DNA-binding NarL/FixJ family response regulator